MLCNLSLTWSNPDDLLSEDDIQLEENQELAALSSSSLSENPWESYNEWQCFETRDVALNFIDHFLNPRDLSEETKTPALQVELDNAVRDFDVEPQELQTENCQNHAEKIMMKWRNLLEGERFVCLYAAHLQDISDDESYWVLSKIKTSKGYWPEEGTP